MNRFPRVHGLRNGYDPEQVDALILRIEATLGRGALEGPPVTADDIRMSRFDIRLGGYHEVAVDFALEAFVIAIETRGVEREEPAPGPAVKVKAEDDDAPTLPGLGESESVAETMTAAWLESQAARVERVSFRPGRLGSGYNEDEVDGFLDRVVATLRGTTDRPLSADEIRTATFSTVMFKPGYSVSQVDAFLTEIATVLDGRSAPHESEGQRV
ncbi:DivIVA domain-containing protein [Sphaerisporangium aureirubrum]|uniref:DivIVA domain-containing protein n=1 Tax=Sphaerisporangium aureirubrum TaxID=1544736 RepID=A0ABW1NQH3_9ACTN